MTKTIWKYELNITNDWTLKVPRGAKFLPYVEFASPYSVTTWALVDPEAEKVLRDLYVMGTGHLLPDVMLEGSEYVGSARDSVDGFLVFHLFVSKEA